MAERRFNLLIFLPPILFAAFAVGAYVGLKRENPDELPSAFVGRPAPSIDAVTAFPGQPTPGNADLTAPGVKLVNFWASWCAPCRAEHPNLLSIGAEGVPIYGVNYKDAERDASEFLSELGNPYAKIAADATGRTGIDWGIYGVPETFVVGADGTVLMRHPGPITREVFEKRIRPLLQDATG
jgi:cytochrome c biogenesis protein CcmG, thiol:disulfide interchange protein DsbE